MIVTFRIRRDTAANWTSANPVLALGEPGLETDTRRVKYGDGATAWTALGYASIAVAWGGITGSLADQADLTAALNAKVAKAANLSDLTNIATARTNLGLGSLAIKSSVNDADWSGADLSIGNGGTGASTAAAARTALGAQAASADLDAISTAWATYAPTPTAGVGSFGAAPVTSGHYKKVGKTVFFSVTVSIANNGTASSFFTLSLPVASANYVQSSAGNENQAAGFMVVGTVLPNSTTLQVQKYDASYPGGSGYRITINGCYEAA